MDKFITKVAYFLMALMVVLWFFDQKAQAATLTTHAKTILKIELAENNIHDKEKIKQIMCLAENIYLSLIHI